MDSHQRNFEPFNIDLKAQEFAEEEKTMHDMKGKRAALCMNPNIAKRICDKLKVLKVSTAKKYFNIHERNKEEIRELILREIESKNYGQVFDVDKITEEFAEELQLQEISVESAYIRKRISQRFALKARSVD